MHAVKNLISRFVAMNHLGIFFLVVGLSNNMTLGICASVTFDRESVSMKVYSVFDLNHLLRGF